MDIKNVVTLAKYSELSGLSMKDDINVIVAFLNLGMLELYKRFPIKVEEYMVELVDDELYYAMPANFMYATAAYGEVSENTAEQTVELPINGEDDDKGVFFIDWNTLQVPKAVTGAFISILYVAKPDIITVAQAQDGITELAIPDTLVDCLLSYVGYRGHMGVKSDGQSENNAHWLRFERNIKKTRDLGVAFPSDTMGMPDRLAHRGFA